MKKNSNILLIFIQMNHTHWTKNPFSVEFTFFTMMTQNKNKIFQKSIENWLSFGHINVEKRSHANPNVLLSTESRSWSKCHYQVCIKLSIAVCVTLLAFVLGLFLLKFLALFIVKKNCDDNEKKSTIIHNFLDTQILYN